MRILQILQPVKIKVFAPTAQDKQDKLVVPYSLQAGLVNSGQLPAANCVLCWQWAGERGLEVQISWALPRDDCPTGSRADNEKPGREDWKWGQCRFTSESWCNAGSSRVLVWCVCDRMSQRMEGWRYRSLRLEVVVSACHSSWDMSLCWLSREEAAGEALVWTLGLQGIWTQARLHDGIAITGFIFDPGPELTGLFPLGEMFPFQTCFAAQGELTCSCLQSQSQLLPWKKWKIQSNMHTTLSTCQNKATGKRKAQAWRKDDTEAITRLSLILHHFFYSLDADWLGIWSDSFSCLHFSLPSLLWWYWTEALPLVSCSSWFSFYSMPPIRETNTDFSSQ